jgi:hypothetical protein
MDAIKLRPIFLVFAAALFFFAFAFTDGGGNRDIVKASIAIGYSIGGCVALISAAIVKKDS